MEQKELVKALRQYYNLPDYMLDAEVLYCCANLPGRYWVQIRAAFLKAIRRANWKAIFWTVATIGCFAFWMLISRLAFEELAR